MTLAFNDANKKGVNKIVTKQNIVKMEIICNFNKYGYCKFKDECDNQHEDIECNNGSLCKEVKICPFRHPRMCKRMIMEGFCSRGQRCAYNHKTRLSHDNKEIKSLEEDIKNLNAEMNVMKETLNSLLSLKQEFSKIQKDVTDIKKDIKLLSNKNRETVLKITALEEELQEDTDDEVYEETANALQKSQEEGTDTDEFKCELCEFTTKGTITFKKHVNTKHPKVLNSKVSTTAKTDDCENNSEDENDFDLFSLEIVDNEIICVCNICDTGLDNDSELNKHMLEEHGKSLKVDNKFDKWTDCKSRDCGTCMECSIDNYQ